MDDVMVADGDNTTVTEEGTPDETAETISGDGPDEDVFYGTIGTWVSESDVASECIQCDLIVLPVTTQCGTSADDGGNAVAVDNNGHFYVTGYTGGSLDGNPSTGGDDIFLTKWKTDGTKVWTKQWGTGGDDTGNSVAVDSGGNIYVVGSTDGSLDGNPSAGQGDIFLTKWQADGEKVWTRQWGTGDYDKGRSVAIDGSGNIYVTGYTGGALDGNAREGHYYNIFLTKWQADGTKEWTRQWNILGAGYTDSWGYSLTVGNDGNIYVTGEAYAVIDTGMTSSEEYYIFLTEWQADGTSGWTKQWGSSPYTPAYNKRGYSVAVDGSGSIYVTGYASGSVDGNPTAGSRDVFLTRWHVSGLKIWTKQWGTGDYDEGRSIAIDSDGDLYVLGDTRYPPVDNPNAGGYDISLNKWKADGTKVWTTQWGTIGDDEANSVAIDSGGNIYVTGRTYGSLDGKPSAGGYDIFVSIITNDTADTDTPDIDTMPDADTPSCADSAWQVDAGVVAECVDGQWVVRRTTKQWGTGDDDGTSVAVDGSGNIYVTGVTAGDFDGNASAGGDDIFLIKWDATGSKAWTKQWGTGNDERGKSVVIDGGGDIYVTGYTAGSLDGNSLSGSNDIFLTKWNPNGSKAWTKQWGTSNGDEGSSVAVDGSGNIYVTGSTAGSFDGNQNAGSSDVFLTKWNSDGTKGWVRQWGTANEDRSYSIALDGSGNIYVAVVAGDVFDVNLTEGVPLVLTKWKPDGAEAWTKQLGMFAYGTGIETSVAIDKGGNIYVAGYTAASYDGNPSMGWYDSFLVKWKADGTKDWSRQWGTDDYDYGEAVAVDGSGNIYVTGRTGGSVDGNPTQGWWDVFLTKWRADGTKVWTKQWGTSDADAGSSVAVDSGGKIYVMGSTKGSFDGNPSAAGDIFLSVIYDN